MGNTNFVSYITLRILHGLVPPITANSTRDLSSDIDGGSIHCFKGKLQLIFQILYVESDNNW